jgi:hypothetical protein
LPYRATWELHIYFSIAGVEGAIGSNRGGSNDEGATTGEDSKCGNHTARGLVPLCYKSCFHTAHITFFYFAHAVPKDGLLQVPQDPSSLMADDTLSKNIAGTCNDIESLEDELTHLMYVMTNAELDPSHSGNVIELLLVNPKCSHLCYLF